MIRNENTKNLSLRGKNWSLAIKVNPQILKTAVVL